jgi:succinyl-CoA synthetase alpha subunit
MHPLPDLRVHTICSNDSGCARQTAIRETQGHAGAIVSGGHGTAASKIAALREAGIEIAETPSDMADALIRRMKRA